MADIIDFNARREARRVARGESPWRVGSEDVTTNDAGAARVYAGFGTEPDTLPVWHEAPSPSVTPRRRGSTLDNIAAVWFALLEQDC